MIRLKNGEKGKRLIMKKEIKIVLLLLFFTILVAFFPNKIYAVTLSDIKNKFPDKRYWNHVAAIDYHDTGKNCICNNPDGTTDEPCKMHGGSCSIGEKDCNEFDEATQCKGFAYKVFFDYYNKHHYECERIYDKNKIKPGDILAYYGKYTDNPNFGHTIWVIGVDDDNIYAGECNAFSPCIISWGRKIPKTDINSVIEVISAPYAINALVLTGKINPYRPSELTWTEVEGAKEYRIRAINKEGVELENPDNIGRPSISSGDFWTTTETTYSRTLPAGDYEIYIEAYNSNGEFLKKSNCISVSSVEYPNVPIYFENSKFEEYMVGYIKHLSSWNNLGDDNKIYFNDLPRVLAIGYSYYGTDYEWKENYNCRMYILDENGKENYDIEKFETISSSYMNANLSADSFKDYNEITSVKDISFYGMSSIKKFNDFIALFPNLETVICCNDNVKYDSLESLSKLTKLNELSIWIDETSDDIDNIAKIKTLKQLTLYGIDQKEEVDFSFLKDLIYLKDLSINYINIKDTKINNSSIDGLGLNYLTLNGNKLINGLSNLKHLNLYSVGLPDNFTIENTSLKSIDMYSSSLISGMFDGASSLEKLNISCNGFRNEAFYWKGLSKLKKLRSIDIDEYCIYELSFLEELTDIEYIALSSFGYTDGIFNYGASSLGNLDKLLNLKKIIIRNSNIEDISGLKNTAQNGKLELVEFTDNKLLKPNSKTNQPVFDILNKKGIKYTVDNYQLKEYVNSSNINILDIDMKSLGTIGAFKTYKESKIENLLTNENFPILESYDINVISHSGNEKHSEENVGSKDKVQIVNSLGEILQEYTVIVPGDVTGNGEVKLFDAFKILSDSVKKVLIDELDREIRDYNNDRKVGTYDALQYMKETIKE